MTKSIFDKSVPKPLTFLTNTRITARFVRLACLMMVFLGGLPASAQPAPTDAQHMYDTLVAYLNTEVPVRYVIEISALGKSSSTSSNQLEVYVGGFDEKTRSARTLVKFVKPATFKGRLFLYESGRLWVYFPNTNQPLRVPPQEQLFGEADVGSILDIDFRRYFKLADSLPKSGLQQDESIVLEPIAQEAPYGRLVFHFKQGKPYKGEYYASSGKLLKWAKFDHYAQSGNKRYVQEVRVYAGSDTAAAHGTLIRYTKVDFIRLPDVNFKPEYLKNFR
jgi:hypothetical protein